ncbi:hypothetical protein EG329_013143 [Mollisiaceae sp. DMI_Dod_QoI]|nr:hypothetical protein EG329_013143 [Helotiales sp. DMI_Dod_QoI]
MSYFGGLEIILEPACSLLRASAAVTQADEGRPDNGGGGVRIGELEDDRRETFESPTSDDY